MNRTSFVLVGLLVLTLGMFVGHSVYRTLQSKTAAAKSIYIVVAANDIGVGAKIEDKDIEVQKVSPATNLPPGFFSTKWQVIGRGVVLPIAKGEFILPIKLADSRLAGLIPPGTGQIPRGMRAVSVRVNDVVAVAGFIVPGTHLDVLLTDSADGINKQPTTTILENVRVLAAMQVIRGSQTTSVVTLLVSPQDAEKLTLASSKGHIQLVLRNPLDQEQPRQRDTPLKPIPPKIPRLHVKPIPPEVPLSPRLGRSA